jgi:hypothetical protein
VEKIGAGHTNFLSRVKKMWAKDPASSPSLPEDFQPTPRVLVQGQK